MQDRDDPSVPMQDRDDLSVPIPHPESNDGNAPQNYLGGNHSKGYAFSCLSPCWSLGVPLSYKYLSGVVESRQSCVYELRFAWKHKEELKLRTLKYCLHTFSAANAPELLRNLSIYTKVPDFCFTRGGDKWNTPAEILSKPLEKDREKMSTPSHFRDVEKVDLWQRWRETMHATKTAFCLRRQPLSWRFCSQEQYSPLLT